jgi:hypothetical protein
LKNEKKERILERTSVDAQIFAAEERLFLRQRNWQSRKTWAGKRLKTSYGSGFLGWQSLPD